MDSFSDVFERVKQLCRGEMSEVAYDLWIRELELTALVSAQNPSCNPQLLVNAIEAYLPECKPDFARIRRLEVYDEQGEPFR